MLEQVTLADLAAGRATRRRAVARRRPRRLGPALTGREDGRAFRTHPDDLARRRARAARRRRASSATEKRLAVVARRARRGPLKPRCTMRSIIASRVVPFGREHDLEVVRPHERVAEPVRLADERHHELVRRLLVEVARRRRPARPCPRFITTTSSATSIASSWSCVTITVVVCVSSCRRRSHSAQLGPHLRVERAERLVEQQHRRVDRERAGEAHPLPLAARELRRVALREALELDELRAARPRAPGSRPSAACGSSGRTRRCRTPSCA